MRYYYDKIIDFKVGDLFWECCQRASVQYKVIEAPTIDSHGDDGYYADFKAEDIKTGNVVSFRVSDRFQHYGPRLYAYDAYERF